jgi:arylsulfatase A-like enzyme
MLLLAALAAGPLGCSETTAPERPNVLVITLDTTRADHLSVYGYARPTSPNLEELATHADVYERAYSTSSWTLPAHASLFTGRYPTSHGMRHDPAGELVLAEAIEAPEGIRARALSEDAPTLAELLGAAGYRTGAVVAGPWLHRSFGLSRGFHHYDDDAVHGTRRASEVTDGALRWLEQADEPFLLFLNYFDPHAPYAPPPRYRKTFLPPGTEVKLRSSRQAPALYDAEILYMDEQVGRLLRELRERGLYENTLVIVTADHGELLGDYGTWGHERYLWEPLVRVPLVVKPAGPRRSGRRERMPTSVVDILPLVLGAVGLDPPAGLQGYARRPASEPLLAEVSPMSARGATGHWRALWRGSVKAMSNSLGESYLFDLEQDPGESENLAARDPAGAERSLAELARAFDALPEAAEPEAATAVDPEALEALRELGYVER